MSSEVKEIIIYVYVVAALLCNYCLDFGAYRVNLCVWNCAGEFVFFNNFCMKYNAMFCRNVKLRQKPAFAALLLS